MLKSIAQESLIKTINYVKKSVIYLKDKWFESELFNSNEYTKFIVIGQARTGTTFLSHLLNSHSQIVCFQELFNPNNLKLHRIGWGIEGFPQDKDIRALWKNKPIDFLEKQVFKKMPKKVLAVGFKMTYAQMIFTCKNIGLHSNPKVSNDTWKVILPYLKNMSDLKIIHIKRKNKLETYVSNKMAIETNKWVKSNKFDTNNGELSIYIDYQDCMNWLNAVQAREEKFDDFWKNHAHLNIFYEELQKDYNEQIDIIYNFLGLDYEIAIPKTSKRSTKKISEVISNYVELKERFRNTPWYELFRE